jgi:hypothetical protein
MLKFARLFVCAACLAAALPSSAQKPTRKVTLPALAGIVLEQQLQLDELNKKLNEAETRLNQAKEECRKQAESAAARTVTVHQSPPAPITAACDHSDMEKQIKKLRAENGRIRNRINVLENAVRELQHARKQGERHRKQLAEALAAVQREFPQQIAGLSSAIAKLELGIDTVKKTVEFLDAQMDAVSRVLKKNDSRLGDLEKKSAGHDKAIARLEKEKSSFQQRIHFGIAAEAWAARAWYAVGGGAYLQVPLAGGPCSVQLAGAAGWRKGNEAAYAAQLMGRCGRTVHVRFGGLALFGDSKVVGGTVGIGYSRPYFAVFADVGPGAEKLAGQDFRISYMVKGGLGLNF